MSFRSDLINEIIDASNIEGGCELIKSHPSKQGEISIDSYEITDQEQSDYYNKPIGSYRILSIGNLLEMTDKQIDGIVDACANTLRQLLGKISKKDKILICGLGNRHISADSLGVGVARGIDITMDGLNLPKVMTLAPSVWGLTGIETYDIIKGVVDRVKPTHLILIDSLCARDSNRLCKSIQFTNTGMCPGSGIGNNRRCIDKSIVDKVYSIGVPLLVYADTFIDDNFTKNNITLERIKNTMQKLKKHACKVEICELLKDVSNAIKYNDREEIVTIKDIEEIVKILSGIISKALNMVLLGIEN